MIKTMAEKIRHHKTHTHICTHTKTPKMNTAVMSCSELQRYDHADHFIGSEASHLLAARMSPNR